MHIKVRKLTDQEVEWAAHQFLYYGAKARDKRPQVMGLAIGDHVRFEDNLYRLYDWQADEGYPEGAYAILIHNGTLTEGVSGHNLTRVIDLASVND